MIDIQEEQAPGNATQVTGEKNQIRNLIDTAGVGPLTRDGDNLEICGRIFSLQLL